MDIPQTCRTCANFSRPVGDRMIEGTGFGRCQHQPVGYYVSPYATCRFEPSRWREAREGRHA